MSSAAAARAEGRAGLRTGRLIATLVSLLVLCALSADTSARAAILHPYTGVSFGPGGVASGSFGEVVGVAVDQASGDVFVLDNAEGGRVYKFDSSGAPVDFASTGTNVIEGVGSASASEEEIAVDSSAGPDAGDIYVANTRGAGVYSEAGTLLDELSGGEMCGVAVGPTGAVYVGISPSTVRRYAPVANPVTNTDETGALEGLSGVCNVAVDGSGAVYAATYSGGVTEYDALQFGSLAASGTMVDQSGTTLAVDSSNSEVLIDEVEGFAQYDGSVEPPARVGTSGGASEAGALARSFGVAVDHSSGDIYVGNLGSVEIFGPAVTAPSASTGAVTGVSGSGATLHGTVEPEGVEVTSCVFEYGTSSESLTQSAPCAPAPPYTGNGTEALTAQLSGLTLGTTYHYRVAVSDAAGTQRGDVQTFRTSGPVLAGERFSEVGFTDAEVQTTIEAPGETVSYFVEYGPTSAYGSTTQAASVAVGSEPAEVRVELVGLQAATTYHARLVASNQGGTAGGPDVMFTTHVPASTLLPDDRGYEKVSPNANADSNAYQDSPGYGAEYVHSSLPFAVAENGDAVAYTGGASESGGTGFVGTGQGNEYLATRTPGGWSARTITPTSTGFYDQPIYQAFAPDLSAGFLTVQGETPLASNAPGGRYTIPYERSFDSQEYQPLVTSTPPNRSAKEFGTWDPLRINASKVVRTIYAGSSADRSHMLFVANDALTANAVDGGSGVNNLYDSHDGAMTLVNVLPGGGTEANATFGGPPQGEGDALPVFEHDISADGSRVFWTDLNTHDLYVRENDTAPQSPEASGHCTVASDACTVLVAEHAQFWDAAADGSRVLYSSGGDLYEYELATGESIDLAPGAETLGVVGASEDLSYVYFVGDGAVAPGATHQECRFVTEQQEQEEEAGEIPAVAGCNLYAIHVGSNARFVGRLSSEDEDTAPNSKTTHAGDWDTGLTSREAEATPDGLHLLFVSRHSLTAFHADLSDQVYVYDFPDGQLACASCNQSGEAPGGNSTYNSGHQSAYLPISRMNTMLPHWITDGGDRVFFDTLDPLVPGDSNHATDVYEWERDGTGTCTYSPGCIYLLSDGTSAEGSYLIGASATGDDVFLTTRGQLLAEDENDDVDVYDLRVGAAPPPVSPGCSGTGCQGVPSAPPVFATPASSTYAGVGNLESPAAGRAASRSKPPTRAQRLAKALRACAKRSKDERGTCKATARKRYGPKPQVKKARRVGRSVANGRTKTAMRSARSKGGKR